MDTRELRSIREDLAHPDAEVRRLAVERMSLRAGAEGLPLLVERLGDPDWRVRKAAVERLAAAPSARVGEALVAALADGENPGRRNAATEALVRCGGEALPALLEASAAADVDVRKLAVDALGGIADPRSTRRLLECLADPDPNVRGAAADALGAVGDAEALAPLLALARREGEDALVRLAALCALERLGAAPALAELKPALAHPLLRGAALALLGRGEEAEALDELLEGLAASSRSTREAAMQALLSRLARAGPDQAHALAERVREAVAAAPGVVEDAARRLEEADARSRLWLVQFLGLAGAAACAPAILQAVCDEPLAELALGTLEALGPAVEPALDGAFSELGTEARRLACTALGRTRGPRAAARLRRALADPEAPVRAAAARALSECADAGAVDALVERLARAAAEPEPETCEELGALGDALVAAAGRAGLAGRVLRALVGRLSGAGEAERAEIARVLGRLGSPDAAEPVALLLRDPAASVRRAAVESLARLSPGCESLQVALADESPEVRIAAARAVPPLGAPGALEHLACLARDPDARVRGAAVGALACGAGPGLGGPERGRLLEILIAALGDLGSVAIAAVEGLAALGTPEAARAALPALRREEPELVQSAVRCLGASGDPDALEYLVPLLAHPHWLVRAEASLALARRGATRALPALLRRLDTEDDDFARDALLRALERLEE
jgi:HEAT repeat protein